jgi:hypothetical protein
LLALCRIEIDACLIKLWIIRDLVNVLKKRPRGFVELHGWLSFEQLANGTTQMGESRILRRSPTIFTG